MNPGVTVPMLAVFALATLASCAEEPPPETLPQQLVEQEPLVDEATAAEAQRVAADADDRQRGRSAEDAAKGINLLARGYENYRNRRRAVLPLWVAGNSVDQIAVATGYKISGVIEVIENYRDDYRKHKDQIIDELVYPDYLTK